MKFESIRWSRFAAVGLVAFSALSVGGALAGDDPTSPRAADEKIAERRIAPEGDEKLFVPDGNYLGGQGVVEPRDRETKVAGAVPGRVAVLHVAEGARVEKGALLVELDSEVTEASVAIAEADVAREEADRARVKSGERSEDRVAINEDSKAAAARAAQSAGVLERTRKAYAGGGVSGDELDRAEKAAAQDAATAAAALARRNAAFAGSRSEDQRAADARLAASKARLEEAKARLAQTRIVAPIDGEVLSVKIRAGEFYQPSSEGIVVMGDTRQMRARIDLDERDVSKVKMGAKVLLRVTSSPGKDYSAKVVEIGRRMGRKNVRSDDPVEKNDAKILEVVAEVEHQEGLIVGQRVTGFVSFE